MTDSLASIKATIVQGHQVASGTSANSPYPAGTIALQKPHFKALGLDLSTCFNGTLNLQLSANSFCIVQPDFCFENLRWIEGFNPETFSLVACQLEYANKRYSAWIYYPHPETKTQHFQQANLIEIIAEEISGLSYGKTITLHYDTRKLRMD